MSGLQLIELRYIVSQVTISRLLLSLMKENIRKKLTHSTMNSFAVHLKQNFKLINGLNSKWIVSLC